MATFITSKGIGEIITINITTSTGYWKYNHDGIDSDVYAQDSESYLEILNPNGEFTIIPCDESGNVSGDITTLYLNSNQLTSFDGTGLSSLTQLNLNDNLLTSFDGTGLSSLTQLDLSLNQLTSFDGTGLLNLVELYLGSNQLTSFDGTTFEPGLNRLDLGNNQLTSFDGTGLSALTYLYLNNNQLTSFNGTGLSNLIDLDLRANQLSAFNGTGLTSLVNLHLGSNQIEEFLGTDLFELINLALQENPLITFQAVDMGSLINLNLSNLPLENVDVFGMSSLRYLSLNYVNISAEQTDDILSQLASNQLANGWSDGYFEINGYRTSASTEDYNYLLSNGWQYMTLEIALPPILQPNPTFITSKSLGQTITLNITTSTGYWRYKHGLTESPILTHNTETLLTVTYPNGFTIVPCDESGNVSGEILVFNASNYNQITSFDGTYLSSLTQLNLGNNQLTSFDGTGLSALTYLYLNNNQLTSFNGTGLSNLTELYLNNNQFTSFNGTGLSSLTKLFLGYNQITSFDITDLTNLTRLYFNSNTSLTSEDNDLALSHLNSINTYNGIFLTEGERTTASDSDYDALISKGWTITLNFTNADSGSDYGSYYYGENSGIGENNLNVDYYYGENSGIGEKNLIIRNPIRTNKLKIKGIGQINR